MSEFSKEEQKAMRDTARERKRSKDVDGEQMLREALEALPEADRDIAKRVCNIIRSAGPSLAGRTFYGMPAFGNAGGKVVVFFQGAQKFKTRYCTLGFQDQAKLDDGAMWPTSFAVASLTPEVESRIAELVKRAVG